MKMMNRPHSIDAIRRGLLAWYRRARRDLPWRESRDPYAVWISEIMLQQTRVETVIPYYRRWMKRFPTVESLANTPLDEILSHWSGLGYYARARNLHRAAKEVVTRYGGRFPQNPPEVRALPGIGRYTAGAICSIAYGLPEPILDGNVVRVLARLDGHVDAADDKSLLERLWKKSKELVPTEDAADFNQALMELGALVCTPREPRCEECPIRSLCTAQRTGDPHRYPAPKRRRSPKLVESVSIMVRREGCLLLLRRPPAGLFGGLWEPPTMPLEAGEHPEAGAKRVIRTYTGLHHSSLRALGTVEHELTHRRMRFLGFVTAGAGTLRVQFYEAARWVKPGEIETLGVAAWTQRLLKVTNEERHEHIGE
jgi:A/G-specific adenine glycosylase